MIRWKIAQWFERRWWQWYLRGRDKTQYLAWKRTYWAGFLAEIGIAPDNLHTVADLGCGPAGLFIALPNAKAVEAVDPLLSVYERDLAHFTPKEYANTRFVQSSLEQWQPAHVQYDAIFCINAINHVHDIHEALQRICQAAHPTDTTVVITTDAHRYDLLQRIFALVPGDILHPHQYTLDGYLDLMRNAGFGEAQCILLKQEAIFEYWALVWRREE